MKLTSQLQSAIARPVPTCPVQVQVAPELSGVDEEVQEAIADILQLLQEVEAMVSEEGV